MSRWFAAALLVTVGFLATPHAVPIYDGVGTPDEPYKHVGRSPAPAAASLSGTVTGSLSPALQLKSTESGPQVLVDLATGAFDCATPTITLTATPLTADGRTPTGTFDGNAYRITASPGATLRPEATQGFVFLRAADMTTPDPVIVHRTSPDGQWVQTMTTRAGRDILSTSFRGMGDYAVVRLPGSTPLTAGGLSVTKVLLIGAGVLVLLTITVLVLRRPEADA